MPLTQWFSTGGNFAPQWAPGDIWDIQFGTCGDIFIVMTGEVPNILKCTELPPITKSYLIQNVKSAKAEKFCPSYSQGQNSFRFGANISQQLRLLLNSLTFSQWNYS